MHALIIITFCVTTIMDFATESKAVPGVLKFTPEMLTAVITVIVMLRALRGQLSIIPLKYWVAFGILTFVVVCGVLSNSEGVGPTLAGTRYYLRAIPLFFLPAVANFSPTQLRTQLKVFITVALVQVPVAVYQRWTVMREGRWTGDDVRGTLMDSGVLSIFLICIVCVLTAFVMRGQIRKRPFLILFFVLLLPTTINETKATAVFLPIGLMATVLAVSPPGKRIQVFFGGAALLATFAALFIPLYAAMNSGANTSERKEGIVEFFTNQQQLDTYINDKKEVGFGTKRMVGRGTAIKFPLTYLARDPLHLAFGLGIGNASHSALGENFTGKYYELFQNFMVTAGSAFLLELGVIGIAMVLLLYWLVLSDAFTVMKADTGITGSIAAGWVGVVCIMGLATFYNVIHAHVSLGYPYWYFAGMIAARRGQLMLSRHMAPAPQLRRAAA
jgi:hypothetical protein